MAIDCLLVLVSNLKYFHQPQFLFEILRLVGNKLFQVYVHGVHLAINFWKVGAAHNLVSRGIANNTRAL